ncbi:hypothetical protein [Patiriisocius sp. Uisw_017]|uniref:hypothetical protein n=1 Tax=Patiriisocius sp. Uisw_017 TaxID=3230968 RepID=UPI0039EB64AA
MNNIEIIKYICFGISFLIGGIIFSFQDDLMNPKMYSKALYASGLCFLIGVILELSDFFYIERGMTLLVMSIGIIYVAYFKLFLNLFIKWKGTKPIITSASSMIGGGPIGGFTTKYDAKRRITGADFIFSFVQALVPIFTIFGLLILIIELNR